jgi:hypothetical protein
MLFVVSRNDHGNTFFQVHRLTGVQEDGLGISYFVVENGLTRPFWK